MGRLIQSNWAISTFVVHITRSRVPTWYILFLCYSLVPHSVSVAFILRLGVTSCFTLRYKWPAKEGCPSCLSHWKSKETSPDFPHRLPLSFQWPRLDLHAPSALSGKENRVPCIVLIRINLWTREGSPRRRKWGSPWGELAGYARKYGWGLSLHLGESTQLKNGNNLKNGAVKCYIYF